MHKKILAHLNEAILLFNRDLILTYINTAGEIIIGGYDRAEPFSEGLAGVRVDGLWGFIDNTGSLVIEPQFERVAWGFSEGLAGVYDGQKKKFGFIDKTGNFVIEPKYEFPWKFTNGLARVDMGSSWGYINKTGEFVWKSEY